MNAHLDVDYSPLFRASPASKPNQQAMLMQAMLMPGMLMQGMLMQGILMQGILMQAY